MVAEEGVQIVRTIPFTPGPLGMKADAVVGPDGNRYVVLSVETLTAHAIYYMTPDFAAAVVAQLDDSVRNARRPALIRPTPGIVIPKLNGTEPA